MSIATTSLGSGIGATHEAECITQAQLNSLVRSVGSTSMNRQDAEDAVQDAWLVLHQKAPRLDPGPIDGYLARTARFKALHARDKATKATSLDALVEVAGDSVGALSDGAFSLEAHVNLAELTSDPVGRQIVHSVHNGGAAQLAPRGENHQCARYTDEQVRRVRQMRAAGISGREIERETGVPAGYVSSLARRTVRVTGTTEGWSRSKILDAIKRFYARHGRAPRLRDHDPLLPSPTTVDRYFGTWRQACNEAAVPSAYGERRMTPWTTDEMIRAFCAFRLERGRWPNRDEVRYHAYESLPSFATIRRHLGSTRRSALIESLTAGLDM